MPFNNFLKQILKHEEFNEKYDIENVHHPAHFQPYANSHLGAGFWCQLQHNVNIQRKSFL